MVKTFPTIKSSDYIDTGITDIQARDDVALTLSWGPEPIKGDDGKYLDYQFWINSNGNHEWRYWNPESEEWELAVNPANKQAKKSRVSSNFQLLNNNLSDFSRVDITYSDRGVISKDTFVPVTYYYVDNISQCRNSNEFSNNIKLKKLSKANVISTQNIENNCIPKSKINSNVIVDHPFTVGDTVISLLNYAKKDFLRLSTSNSNIFTVGNTGSSSTYKNKQYYDLFEFVWENLNTEIYSSIGGRSDKGQSALSDWNSNKRLALPIVDLPNKNKPKSNNIKTLYLDSGRTFRSDFSYRVQSTTVPISPTYDINVPRNGYYYLTVVGGGGGGSYGTGGAGATWKGVVLLKSGDATLGYGYGGKAAADYARNHDGGRGGVSSFKMKDGSLSVICNGGRCGYASRSEHRGDETNYGYSEAPIVQANSGVILQTDISSSFVSRRESWIPDSDYGAGAGGGHNTSPAENGLTGYISLVYIGPEEYGTYDSTIVKELDNVYDNINFYIKF